MPTVENDDDLPPPELAVSAELLTSVFADDHDAVLKLRDLEDMDWWNVALSYAQLMKGIFSGEPSALKVLTGTFEDVQRLRDSD